ncbi:MAG: LD-carboxypeptidase [Candidatus Kapabacteria bacterium]|jgi:muramoyltetrapeptide carboxypeptidase|nr:LD-carboxypeptidase [Candidatus Kapabacteria bacterium]
MDLSRRQFLSLAAAGFVFGKTALKAAEFDLQDELFMPKDSGKNLPIFPPALNANDTIALTAPASHTSIWETRQCVRHFRKLGYNVEIGKTITNRQKQYTYLSASDDERAAEFMHYIQRKDVKFILSGRGGYGVMRILDKLDFDIIKQNPKIIIGYSDITALLNAIYQKTGIITFHGPVGVSTFNNFSTGYLNKVIKKTDNFSPITFAPKNAKTIVGGTAEGRLVGGNLTLIASTIGTDFQVDCDDKILFFEEVSEEPYKFDKMLTQMYLAGMFEHCRGVAIGYIKNLNRAHNFFPGHSFTVKQVLERRFKSLNIPTIVGFSFGHLKNNITIPIGVNAKLDADKKILTLLESAVV